MRVVLAIVGLAAALVVSSVDGSWAQVGPGGLIDPIRDCQTIRQCRYTKGGSFRGCISTYTCKVCRMVPAKCEIGGRTQNCREMRCGWGE